MTMKKHASIAVMIAAALLLVLAGCGGGGGSSTPIGGGGNNEPPAYGPNVSMTMPNTLTGGSGAAPAMAPVPGGLAPMAASPMAANGDPCFFWGHGNGDPFRNGHTMTKFLVGAVASWTCITYRVIRFIDLLVFLGVPKDGTPLDLVDANHQPGDPTWLSVNEISADVTEVKLYWTADHVAPVPGDEGFYLRWDTTGGVVVGKLVVDVVKIANDPADPYDPTEDPAFLRLDFTRDAVQKTGDLYLGFSASHPFVTSSGWRIFVVKNLDATTPKYTAKGVIDMTAQWDPNYTFGEVPQVKSFAVADSIGVGAAIASMVDLGLVLFPIDTDNDHLGEFLFTKDDRYYFGGAPPVIFKKVTAAVYKGNQAIGAGGIITSNADVDAIIAASIAAAGNPVPYAGTEYNSCVTASPTGCVTLLDALFSGGDFGTEANQGAEPLPPDPRRVALDGATYFPDACPPVGSCVWDATGVFLMAP